MSLSAGQQRALNQIEKTLADDDLRLGLLFAAFTRLAGHEAMPVTEAVTVRPRPRRRRMWRMPPAVVTVIGLAVVTSAFIFSQMLPSQQVCRGAVTAVSAHLQPACKSRQVRHGGVHAR